MKPRGRKGQDAEQTVGLDLAIKNTELKEEIRELKEKHNSLLRESLQNQYMRYKMRAESEKILEEQKASLSSILERVELGLKALKDESTDTGHIKDLRNLKTKSQPMPFKENPKQKNKLYTE